MRRLSRNAQVDLRQVIWPHRYQIHTLRPKLFCEPCRITTDRKVRLLLVGLFDPNPEPETLVKIARRKTPNDLIPPIR